MFWTYLVEHDSWNPGNKSEFEDTSVAKRQWLMVVLPDEEYGSSENTGAWRHRQ